MTVQIRPSSSNRHVPTISAGHAIELPSRGGQLWPSTRPPSS